MCSNTSIGSINLENFEWDCCRTRTPEVLTSPTSLEACYTLGIKPIELVYKSLEEYEEALPDLPLSQIYQIYDTDETERQGKLLKCRDLRNKLIFEANKISSLRNFRRPVSEMAHTTKIKDGRHKDKLEESDSDSSEIPYLSDTESQNDIVGKLRNQAISDSKRSRFSSLSKLRSVSNLDFKKMQQSPRRSCPCHMTFNDEDILNEYKQKYNHVLSRSLNNLNSDDKKILDLLLLRKGRLLEWDRQAHDIRRAIDDERLSQMRTNQLRVRNRAERLAQKRRIENYENHKRYLAIEDETNQKKLDLLNYLENKDLRLQKYLDQMEYQKRKLLLERHRNEAIRQLEVGRTMDRLIEADRLYRHELSEKLQKQMLNSERRKRRREQDFARHIAEVNKLEAAKRELMIDRLEASSRRTKEILRNQIEEKEHKAMMNYLAQVRLRNVMLSEGAGNRNRAIEKTRRVHEELLRGLNEWNEKVYQLQLEAQERATINHFAEINRRRANVVAERVLRQERNAEILRRVKENEERRIAITKATIEAKDFRTNQLKERKEEQIQIARLRAQQASELREALREKLDPETFDRKVARAQIECHILNKHPPPPPIHFPRDRRLRCKCCGGSRIRSSSTNSYKKRNH